MSELKLASPVHPELKARQSGPPSKSGTALLLIGAGLAAAAAAGAFSPPPTRPAKPTRSEPSADAVRLTRWSAALLSASVLADSGLEHFRGNYRNRAMYVAPAGASLGLAASLGAGSPRGRRMAFAAITLTGILGLGFHLYNIVKRPGGISWHNMFYAAPFGAPGALALSGIMGLQALPLDQSMGSRAAVRRGRRLGLLTSTAIAGTVGEVALLHFRGAFQNPGMYAPVTIPPAAAAALAVAAAKPSRGVTGVARFLLRATAVLGFAGVGFHAWGVRRNMGGWRNWTQNLFQGPPLAAPPSFIGLAFAGLAALKLLGGGKGRRE